MRIMLGFKLNTNQFVHFDDSDWFTYVYILRWIKKNTLIIHVI